MTKIEITQELVRELFDYKDGILYWKVKTSPLSRINIGDRAGYLNKTAFYERYSIGINMKSYLCSRIIFLWHNGYLPDFVDHRDRDMKNNNIGNLRSCTRAENNRNRNPEKNSSSKFLGVFYIKKNNKWGAKIVSDKKQISLGRFESEANAALAYNEAAIKYHKEFANLNII